MQSHFQSRLRRPWLLACAGLLLCYALAPVNYDGELDLYALANFADCVAVFVSFPLGLIVALGLGQIDFGLTHRSQLWALCLVFGYVQWFHFVPLLCRRAPTPAVSLNLAGDERVAAAAAPPVDPLPAQPAAESPPMPQFNEHGRTPLERVFDNQI